MSGQIPEIVVSAPRIDPVNPSAMLGQSSLSDLFGDKKFGDLDPTNFDKLDDETIAEILEKAGYKVSEDEDGDPKSLFTALFESPVTLLSFIGGFGSWLKDQEDKIDINLVDGNAIDTQAKINQATHFVNQLEAEEGNLMAQGITSPATSPSSFIPKEFVVSDADLPLIVTVVAIILFVFFFVVKAK